LSARVPFRKKFAPSRTLVRSGAKFFLSRPYHLKIEALFAGLCRVCRDYLILISSSFKRKAYRQAFFWHEVSKNACRIKIFGRKGPGKPKCAVGAVKFSKNRRRRLILG
jgi:hypothetical protein